MTPLSPSVPPRLRFGYLFHKPSRGLARRLHRWFLAGRSGARGALLAAIGTTLAAPVAAAAEEDLSIARDGDTIVIDWTETGFLLETATELEGPWALADPQENPHVLPLASERRRFFRLRIHENPDGTLDITLGPEAGNRLFVGEEIRLTARSQDGEPLDTVSWSSGDEEVAVVGADGTLRAVGPGTAIITATDTGDPNIFGRLEVEVLDDKPIAGRLLEGDPGSPALAATSDWHLPRKLPPEAISADPDIFDREILRTEVQIYFSETATVEEVNEVLRDFEGGIVSMVAGLARYLVRIPDPGDLRRLEAAVRAIENYPQVGLVIQSVLARTEPVLRGGSSGSGTPDEPGPLELPTAFEPASLGHHLAIRAHAAWNAREALPPIHDRPWILIADAFGDGEPNSDYGGVFESGDFATDDPNWHGYHVLGILNGHYGETDTANPDRSRITGLFPGALRVRAVDLRAGEFSTWPGIVDGLLQRLRGLLAKDPDARIVVNSSLNSRVLTDAERQLLAFWWTHAVGELGLKDHFVHLTSAGNRPSSSSWDAHENSIFSHAALGTLEANLFFETLQLDNLGNTLVVENRVRSRESDNRRPTPGCGHASSVMEGTISGIGTDVRSFGRCLKWGVFGCEESDSGETSELTGTSMSTPQVAAVAAYAWALDPSLEPVQLKALLLRTAQDLPMVNTAGVVCNPTAPQPVVDAFDAVLAAGGTAARLALLDVTGSGAFDHGDLALLVDELVQRDGILDYSRYDLNGSGQTGGSAQERFDLDGDGSFGALTRQIQGTTVFFDERAVTDWDVLCYYAHSPLYTGDPKLRSSLLDGRCLQAPLPTFTFPEISAKLTIRTITDFSEAGNALINLIDENERRQARVLSPDGKLVDPGHLGGGETVGTGLNDKGFLVGYSRDEEGLWRAFSWSMETRMTALETRGAVETRAHAVNERGWVAGEARFAEDKQTRAVIWTEHGMIDVSEGLEGNSRAIGINSTGTIVGAFTPPDDAPGGFVRIAREGGEGPVFGEPLLLRVPGAKSTVPVALNDAGQVAGTAYLESGPEAFLWDDGRIELLGALDGFSSEARGLDDDGRVVGTMIDEARRNVGFLWEEGEMIDINSLLSAEFPGSVSHLYAMTSSGQMAGIATGLDLLPQLVILTGLTRSPVTAEWTGEGADDLFGSDDNWSPHEPISIDDARFGSVGGKVELTKDVTNERLRIGAVDVSAALSGHTWDLTETFDSLKVTSDSGLPHLSLAGGTLSAARGVVGSRSGDRGKVTVESDGRLETRDSLNVGDRGKGELLVYGEADLASLETARMNGSEGIVTVSGPSSRLDVSDFTMLGMRGHGALHAELGAFAQLDFLMTGMWGSSAISATAGGEIRATDIIASGISFDLDVTAGSTFRGGSMYVSDKTSSESHITVSGNDATLYMNDTFNASRGKTRLHVSNQARVLVGFGDLMNPPPPTQPSMIWGMFGSDARGELEGVGSILSVIGAMVLGSGESGGSTGSWELSDGSSGAATNLIVGQDGGHGKLILRDEGTQFSTRSVAVGGVSESPFDDDDNVIVVPPSTGGRGEFIIHPGSHLQINGPGPFTFEEDATGSILLDGTLFADVVTLGEAVLTGNGTLDGDLVNNAGTVIPNGASPAAAPLTLEVTGDYQQQNEGTLTVQLGGYGFGSEHTRITFGGTVDLDGTLHIQQNNGFSPVPGDIFHFLRYDDTTVRTGTFDSITWDDSFGNIAFDVVYQDGFGGITLVVVDEGS